MPPTWIFDLDNTLHDAEPYIFPEMNRQMTAYVARHMGVDETTANQLRVDYWRHYGSTLAGLLHHSDVDPEHFLRETHRFPDLSRQIRPMRGLRSILRRLPGRKVLFTNAPFVYAVAVLRALRIAHYFDGVVAMQQTGFKPKPHSRGYRRILAQHGLAAARCVMVEDSRSNLVTAKRMGMRTIWLSRDLRHGPAVDFRISRLSDLTRVAARLTIRAVDR
jgi:putative hydrolase of the HAD superfamily